MKMSPKFVIRLAVWSLIMLYLFFDLVLFTGPIKKQALKIQGAPLEKVAADQDRGIVARVFSKPILLSQIDYRVDELLWRQGKARGDISKSERIALRKEALRELCDFALLREKVALNKKEFPVSDNEINAAMKRFASRFRTKNDLKKTMQDFGFEGEKELRFRIAARLQQNKYLAKHIASGIAVTDEEAQAWYSQHKVETQLPERVRARHIFLAANGNSEIAATTKLKSALQLLEKGQDFSPLAQQLSEDQRSKKAGGDLGWMRRARLPKDFSSAAFKLKKNAPEIITTKLGYHLIEITDKAPAQLRSFDEMKSEIIAALETSRRKAAVTQYRRNLNLQHPEKVIIHHSMLSNDWTQ